MAKNQIISAIIPGSLTKKFQPLDISINKPFKSHMRQLWRDWMALDNHTYTKTGQVRRTSYAQIYSLVSIVWEKITTHTIINGFLHSQLIPGVRCCKPSDLTYTFDLKKQLKTKSL